ncbi:MAG: hypothetical protein WDA17_06150 [Sphaerochaetaceae bacterium]
MENKVNMRAVKYIKRTMLFLLIVVTGIASLTSAPVDTSFDVTTTIAGSNLMKVSTTQFTGTNKTTFNNLTSFSGLQVTASGSQTFDAWISVLSNNRGGYILKMNATAMKSSEQGQADAYINYTVSANSKSVTTTGAAGSSGEQTLVNQGAMTSPTSSSYKISLSVDQTSYDNAVSGTYTGTVMFELVTN